MNRKQVIRELAKLGFIELRRDGRFCSFFRTPSGSEVLCDPRDLLTEVNAKHDVQNLVVE